MQNLGKDAQGDLNQDLAVRCHRPPGHKLKLFWHLRSESFSSACQYVEGDGFDTGFWRAVWLLVKFFTNVSRLILRCVRPAFFRAGNLRARVTPLVVIPIVWRKKSLNFKLMEDYQTLVFLQSSHQINANISSVRIWRVEFDLKSRQSCQSFNDGHHLPSNQGLSSSQPDLKMNTQLKVS